MIYLDNQTITRPSPAALEAYEEASKKYWMAVESVHFSDPNFFSESQKHLSAIYDLVGANERDTFLLTSCKEEGISQILQSVFSSHKKKNQVITLNTEEAATLLTIEHLENGKMLPVDVNGHVTRDSLEKAISSHTRLISLSWGNPLTGVIQPIWDIADFCAENDILLHVDATQVLGKVFFRFQDLPIHFLTFDGSVIHGPKSSGGLFIKEDVSILPLIPGGFQQQQGLRGGHLDVSAFFGLGVAAKELHTYAEYFCLEVARLKSRFEEGIKEQFSEAQVLFEESERLPHITVIAFPGVHNDALLFRLKERGVLATTGSGGMRPLEDILYASSIDPLLAKCAVSFGLSRFTTKDEIDQSVEIISTCAKELREISLGVHA